jgi:hypothetical protein
LVVHCCGHGLQAGALIETEKARGGGDAIWMRKKLVKDEIACEAGEEGAAEVAFDAGARVAVNYSSDREGAERVAQTVTGAVIVPARTLSKQVLQ